MRNPQAASVHIRFSFGVSKEYPDGLLGYADFEALLSPDNVKALKEIIIRMDKANVD